MAALGVAGSGCETLTMGCDMSGHLNGAAGQCDPILAARAQVSRYRASVKLRLATDRSI
jgi:hypothetical protein